MAYNKRYNPDALPAHVEPEQAASMLSGSDRPLPDRTAPPRRQDSYSTRPDPRSERDSYSTRPQPTPSSSKDSYRSSQPRPDDRERDRERDRQRYGRDSYDSRPPPASSSYNDPRYKEDRYKEDRQYSSQPSRAGAEPLSPRTDRYQSMASPPPQSYGYQSVGPPPKDHHNRPPQQPPATPAAPPRDANDKDSLWPLFKAVDKDQSGALDERELRTALVNGDMSSFDTHTVKMMIRMFDTDRSGTINFDEFCGLWGFLAAWRTLFDRFDVDKSGNISYDEFSDALVAFGYRLSPAFVSLLFRTYDRRGDNAMSFDLFVQACISLKRMTDVFKKYDDDRDGYITLSFEEFLTAVLRQLG